jgi:molybdopterin converting factor small subunit
MIRSLLLDTSFQYNDGIRKLHRCLDNASHQFRFLANLLERNMGHVWIKINPSIASMATATWHTSYLSIECPFDSAATIGDVLSSFTHEHKEYSRIFYDTATGKISDSINVTLNRTMLVSAKADEVGVKDGDTIIIMPIYEGG